MMGTAPFVRRQGPQGNVPADQRATLFDFVKPIAAAIQQAFGPLCEVVLHDFEDPEHSIIWIQGSVTGRSVGGSVSEIGLQMIRGGDEQPDKIAYVRNSRDGRTVKSTTVLLRDPKGRVFGCFCINLDVTGLLAGRDVLAAFLGAGEELREIPFSDQISEVLTGMIKAAQEEIGRPPTVMTRDERRIFIQSLEARGAFAIQRSVPAVASYLGVSRATIYQYLDKIRNGPNAGARVGGGGTPPRPGR